MPFNQKTLAQLIAQSQSDIESRLPASYARVQEKTLNAVAYAQGGIASGLQSQIAWYSRQVIPSESDPEKLAEWCQAFNVPRKLATTAYGPLMVTVTDAVTIEAGQRWQRPDGMTVEVMAPVTTTGPAAFDVMVKALESGQNSNTPAYIQFTIVSPQAGVQSTAKTDSTGLTGGADIETLERWQSRLIFRLQYPPAGGTMADYERWAMECPGVTRAWAYKWWEYYDVGVTFVMDDNESIIPTPGDVLRVANYIAGHRDPVTNAWTGAPLGPEVFTFAPIPRPVPIKASLTPNNAATQAAAAAAIKLFFTDNLIPESTLFYSKLAAAISDTAGITNSTLLSPSADVQCNAGELLIPGAMEWQ